MVRQSCGDFIYLVPLRFLGGSHLDINSSVDIVNAGPTLPGTALIYTCCTVFIKNIQLQCQSDLVWMVNDMVTGVIECIVRRVVWERAVKVDNTILDF